MSMIKSEIKYQYNKIVKIIDEALDNKLNNSKKLDEIINKEIKLLNSNNKFKVYMNGNKGTCIYDEGLNVYFTTIALAFALKKDKRNEFKDKISKLKFEFYNKNDKIYIKGFDENNRQKFSGKNLFIFDHTFEVSKRNSEKMLELALKKSNNRVINKKYKIEIIEI